MADSCKVEIRDQHGAAWRAVRTNDAVVIFGQAIARGGQKIVWKKVGSAKWDYRHGLYSIIGRIPSDALDTAIRQSCP